MTNSDVSRWMLTGGQVLDVTTGDISTADVVIEGDHLANDESDAGGDHFDCSGLTLVPGLIDAHAHVAFRRFSEEDWPPSYRLLESLSGIQKTLEMGFTTVRDAWGADAGLRDAIADGHVKGPRLLVSLAQLGGTGSIGDHFDRTSGEVSKHLGSPWLPRGVFDGVDDARRAVRTMVRSGADVIKIAVDGSATLPETIGRQIIADDELEEIVAEATRLGVFVMAHAHGARAAEAAARAGVRSIEHGWFLDDDAVDVMKASGTWLVPTLSPVFNQDVTPDSSHWLTHSRESAERSFKLALESGIQMATGTDMPAEADRLGELEHMSRLGMSAADVWRSATAVAAEMIGRDDLGSLDSGKRADVVGFEGDITDMNSLSGRVRLVIKDGVVVYHNHG